MVHSEKAEGKERNARNLDLDGGNNNDGKGNLRITYTNIDRQFTLKYIGSEGLFKGNKSRSAVSETKLRGNSAEFQRWRRDRKGKRGGGVMVLVKDGIQVEDVQYSIGLVEVINITTSTRGGGRRKITVAYIPPKTGAWGGGGRNTKK